MTKRHPSALSRTGVVRRQDGRSKTTIDGTSADGMASDGIGTAVGVTVANETGTCKGGTWTVANVTGAAGDGTVVS